jgi:hypothetical protein
MMQSKFSILMVVEKVINQFNLIAELNVVGYEIFNFNAELNVIE